MLRTIASAALAAICIVCEGCASIGPARLHAVPATLSDSLDFAHVDRTRFIGDDTEALATEIRWAIAQQSPLTGNSIDFLALSGGQEDGAFGAGLLAGWSEHGDRPIFDVVTGTSTGALAAPFAYLGRDYDWALEAMYTKTRASEILDKRYIVAALADDALMDSAPLYRTISRYMTQEVLDRIAAEYRKGRLLLVSTVNLDTSKPVIWNIGAIAASDNPDRVTLVRKIMLASAAVPGMFPPVMIDAHLKDGKHQEMHVDGGTAAQVFLYPPSVDLKRIVAATAPKATLKAYVIRNGPVRPKPVEVERRTLPIAQRALETMVANTAVGDIYRIYATTGRDGIAFNLALIEEDFTEPYTEKFDHRYMVELFRYGRMKGAMGYPWQHAPPGFLRQDFGDTRRSQPAAVPSGIESSPAFSQSAR